MDKKHLLSAREAYVAARDALVSATAAKRATTAAAALADAGFDRDMRLLAVSVRDSSGRALPRAVSEMLGGKLPSALVVGTHQDEVRRATELLTALPKRPDLTYSAPCADALTTSTDALDTAMLADKAAEAALTTAGTALRAARTAFDTAYRKLVAAARSNLEDAVVTAALQRFTRANPKDTTATKAETAAATTSTT